MFENDFDDFAALLDGAISINPNWKPIPPTGKALFFNALAAYSFEQVRAGLTAHLRDAKAGMFQPTPAHIIGHIESRSGGDGRPGADEAWAIAITSRDESETVVWTEETAEAFGICYPVLEAGDEIGARMAFKDAYSRLINEARVSGRSAKWNASMGWDSSKREAAITKASNAGLLPAPAVQALLPNHSDLKPGDVEPEGLKRVKEALAGLQSAWKVNAEKREAALAAEREEVVRRKQEEAAKVADYEKNVIPMRVQA